MIDKRTETRAMIEVVCDDSPTLNSGAISVSVDLEFTGDFPIPTSRAQLIAIIVATQAKELLGMSKEDLLKKQFLVTFGKDMPEETPQGVANS